MRRAGLDKLAWGTAALLVALAVVPTQAAERVVVLEEFTSSG